MDAALTSVLVLAFVVGATGAIAWWLGRSYIGRRIWVGALAAVVGALGVVYVAHAILTP
jgi:hypothetical protein